MGTAALVLAAGWLRAVHLDWGLPEVFEEATPVRKAIEMWGVPGSGIDLNPHFFKYPSLTFYLNFILQSVWYLWLSLSGAVASLNEFRQVLAEDFSRAVLLGRWLQVVLGALLVVPTRKLGEMLGGPVAGWTAALLIAVLPTAVAESRLVSPDMALALAAAWALVAATRIAEEGDVKPVPGLWPLDRPGRGGQVSGSVARGCAPGRPLDPGAPGRRGARGHDPFQPPASGLRRRGDRVSSLPLPFVFLDPGTAAADFGFERRHMIWGHLGREEGRAITFYLLEAIPRGWTLVVALIALLGLGSLMARGRSRKVAIPGLVFLGLSLLILGSWKMASSRYVLPLATLGAVWAGGRRPTWPGVWDEPGIQPES